MMKICNREQTKKKKTTHAKRKTRLYFYERVFFVMVSGASNMERVLRGVVESVCIIEIFISFNNIYEIGRNDLVSSDGWIS